MNKYMRRIKKSGEHRKRYTEQLRELCTPMSTEIAKSVPEGTKVTVNGVIYEVGKKCSNIGCWNFLYVVDCGEYRAITDLGEVGGSTHLHGDYDAYMQIATRADFLEFVNNLPQIMDSFAVMQDTIIEELRTAFSKLRLLAEPEDC